MMKMNKVDLERIKSMLTDAITVMCKSGLTYRAGFSVEGLLGITLLDDDQVFLVNIKETIKTEMDMFPRQVKQNLSYIQESHSSSEGTDASSDEADSPGKPKRKRRRPQKIVQTVMTPMTLDKKDNSMTIEASDINVKKEEPDHGIPLGNDNLNWLGNIMALQQNPKLQAPQGNKYAAANSNSNVKHSPMNSPLFAQGNPQFPATSSQLFPPGGQNQLPALSSILGGPSTRGGGGTIIPDLSSQPEVPIVEEEMVKVTIPDFLGNPATEQHTVNACLRPNPGPGRVRLLESSPISVERDQLIEALRKATYKKEAGYYLMYRLLFLTVGKETLAYCNGPGKRHSDRPSLSDDLINTCKTYARAFCAALGRPVPPNVVLGRAFTVARQNASRPEWKTEDPPDHMMAWNRLLQEASQLPTSSTTNTIPSTNTPAPMPLTSNANSQAKLDQSDPSLSTAMSSSSQFFQQMTSMAPTRSDLSLGRPELSMRSELSLRTDNALNQLFPPNLSLSPVKTNQN